MCGILGADGVLSQRRYRGIAPECKIICGKVLDSKGNGDIEKLILAIEWVLQLRREYPIRVVNISIEIGNERRGKLLQYQEVFGLMEQLWKEDVAVVIAAGNKGPDSMSISPLGTLTHCICVGCHDEEFRGRDGKTCMEYSGRGPFSILDKSQIGMFSSKKPDIVAPGTQIVSCCHRFRLWRKQYYNAYIEKSGTSMATPVVSGALALAMQKYPQITNEDLKRNLLLSARDLGEKWCIQGAGMLDIHKFLSFCERESAVNKGVIGIME